MTLWHTVTKLRCH